MKPIDSIESTEHLIRELQETKCEPEAFQAFLETHPVHHSFHSLSDYLNHYLAGHPDLETSKIYIQANANPSYANQIFNGTKKRPGKYKLIPLCMAMGMDLTEVNRALRLAGQAQLDPRNTTDMALIICINEKVQTIYDVNDFFIRSGLEPVFV